MVGLGLVGARMGAFICFSAILFTFLYGFISLEPYGIGYLFSLYLSLIYVKTIGRTPTRTSKVANCGVCVCGSNLL